MPAGVLPLAPVVSPGSATVFVRMSCEEEGRSDQAGRDVIAYNGPILLIF
jgi:hypothetical protein